VIDRAGRWLMPGLADMHVHTWVDDDLTMFVAAGVTTVRNMWASRSTSRCGREIARGEVLGPTIVTAGALIDGG
jgi:imidazolonepropionase-like amidohydrolase